MAVRWGAGEETLTTCNMDIFPLDKLLETTGLHSGDPLDTLQGCLDPSILSIFEDTPTIETRGLEDESEATLLTALTEILDNVDDENLSPFDTLPESDLLSGQKGREHSPLRRLCLSRTPPEKDTLFGTKPRSTGKTLPRIQQRSDGEEEEDSLTPSPGRLELSSDNELLDWEGFPITFEQGGEDGVSVSLGDLVRHMHPYCMAISLEDDKGEQMLPEGGILLEVVEQGENGEPILAIPEMDHPISEKLDEPFSNPNVFDEADDFAYDSSEHIVVDDDEDAFVKTLLKDAENETCLNVKDKTTSKKPKDKIKDKSPSRRRRKKKSSNSPAACPHEPTEGRVLRSAALKKAAQEPPKKADKKSHKEDKNKNNPAQDSAATTTTTLFTKPKNITLNQTEGRSENTTTLPLIPVSSRQDTVLSNTSAEMGQSSCPSKAEGAQQPETILNLSAPAPEKQESSVAGLTASKAGQVASCTAVLSQSTLVVSEIPHPLPTVTAEPKPKSLSLAEYRRLRQQKKPAPMEKHDDNSTKWPSLPELPKELPPIPYLPDPSLKDPRRSRPQSAKDMEDVKAAWQPRGPGAPPTPEALLAPPAYMVTSSNKVAAATNVPKPPQTPHQTAPTQHTNNTSGAAPILHTEQATTGEEERVTEGPLSHPTSATITTDVIKPAANVSPPTVSHKAAAEEVSKHIDSCGKGSSSPAHRLKSQSQGEPGISERKSSAANPVEAKTPTQELIEAFTSEMGIEATDLTSLLEQFEETQAKEEQSVPEVSGRAAAVGNSSTELVSEKTVVERVRANDLSSTAALTPPATPPHHLWKPLTPVSLLGKSKTAETTKSGLSKVIEIEAQPLPSAKSHCKFTSAAGSVAPDLACKDHDYCLPNKGTSSGETGKRWNVKQHSSITIKSIKQPATQALHHPQAPTVQSATTCAAKAQDYPPTQLGLKIDNLEKSSVLETPDASPTHEDTDIITSPRQGPFGRSYRQSAASCTPSPKERSGARSRMRRSRCSSSSRSISSESDSPSSRSRSRSYSPPQKRYRPCHSRSSSSSSSRSSSRSSSQSSSISMSRSPQRRRRYSYSSSRSGSWSRSRSRSPSPPTQEQWSRKRRLYSPSYKDSYGTSVKTNHEVKRYKEKAIEERRVVYVGRIRSTMTQKELKERFSYFGEIEECTLHFRDHGDNYGFVTYYNTNDAFMAIENGSRLRKPDELPFDLCFGGRRQFCQTSYADLDSSKECEPLPSRNKYHALDFDTLLKQAQQNLKR